MDSLIQAKYISKEIGYGVFAKTKINKNRIIGEYTGVLKQTPDDSTYSWRYKSIVPGIRGTLSIDSKKEGNLLRFVNDYQKHNV